MALGPGKYDDVCEMARQQTGGGAVALIVISGNKGPGFSVISDYAHMRGLPELLEYMAGQIRKDMAT